MCFFFFFSSRRRHTRFDCDWSSDVCSSDLGYMVQPPAGAPPGTNSDDSSSVNANGRIQKLKLLRRGSAMSGAPICIGIIQFASPVHAGITAPKIMISACRVVMELKNRSEEHTS